MNYKSFRAVTALVLIFCMVFALAGNSAVYAANSQINYVSLGDSLADDNGAGSTYPSLFAAWLEKQGIKATSTEITLTGALTSELEAKLAEETTAQAVSNADVLVLSAGNCDLSVYLKDRIENALATGTEASYKDAEVNINATLLGYLYDICESLEETLYAQLSAAKVPDAEAELIVNATVNVTLAAMSNYSSIYDSVMALNPDVKLVQLAVVNTMSGILLNVDGVRVDMEPIAAEAIDALNCCITMLPVVKQLVSSAYTNGTFLYASAQPELAAAAGDNGLYNCPTAAGHSAICDALASAWKNNHTARDEMGEQSRGDCIMKEGGVYAVLGDGTAVSVSYADKVAKEIGATLKNFAADGTKIVDVYDAVSANADALAGASMISMDYGSSAMAKEAMDVMVYGLWKGTVVEYDWVTLLGEDSAEKIEAYLEKVRAELVEEGLDKTLFAAGLTLADAMTMAIESYAYNTALYMVNLPDAIDAIREVNSDALIVIVGMSNPFKDTVLTYGESSFTVGDYLDELVTAIDTVCAAYAMMTDNVCYAATPETETGMSGKTQQLNAAFVFTFIKDNTLTNVTEDGQTYIYQQFMAAVDFHPDAKTAIENKTETGYDVVTYCTECGEELSRVHVTVPYVGLYGDVNGDGYADSDDAALILKYDVGLIEEDGLDLANADVNGDGYVDSDDAALILKLDVGLIDKFPVEE